MEKNEDKGSSSRASKIAIGFSIVVCLLLMMYACGQKREADAQHQMWEELRSNAEKVKFDCIQSKGSLQNTIDSLRLQIEDFKSRMNSTKFNDDGFYSDSVAEN